VRRLRRLAQSPRVEGADLDHLSVSGQAKMAAIVYEGLGATP
jgi:hypothetical protein